MTTTPVGASTRRLERSSTDRIAAGVCGGLGEHLGIDPVIFRVLVATSAFFGVGLLIYAIAWLIIPEPGHPSVADRGISELRRRRVPIWLAAVVGGLIVWAIGIPFHGSDISIPVLIVGAVLFFLFRRRQRSAQDGVSIATVAPAESAGPAPSPFRGWISETITAARERSRRRRPAYLITTAILVVTIGIVAIIDAASRVPLTAYVWPVGIIVVIALLIGAALRRTPIGLSVLLIPVVGVLIAFGNTTASLHDGSGDRVVSADHAFGTHRQAFGRLSLTLPGSATSRSVRIDQAAGQVVLLVPQSTNAIVTVHLRSGQLTDVTGVELHAGWNFNREVFVGTRTPDAVHVDIHVGAGQVSIKRVAA